MTNQNWNDPANPQGQQPTYGQPSAPDPNTPGYQAPGTTPGYSAAGQSPDATYGQPSYGSPTQPYGQQAAYGDPSQQSGSYGSAPSYGSTPSYGSSDSSQGSASSYGSPAPSYGQADPNAAGGYVQADPNAAGSYGSPSYGTSDPSQAGSYGSPAAGAYGATGGYGAAPDSGYGQQSQSYGTPVGGQGGTYGSPVQSGYGDPSAPQVGGYGAQAGAVSPYGYDSGYATPAPALADFGKRALGWLVDIAAPVVAFYVVLMIAGVMAATGDAGSIIGLLLTLVGYVGLFGYMIWNRYLKGGNTGVTLGRGIAKTKLVSEATGQPIGPLNTFVRDLCHFVDSVICYVGWLFPLWDAKRQTIADKIMKTVVINDGTTPTQGQQF